MTLTQITEKGIKDGEILNADIHNSAAIARTKLANVDVVDDTSPQLGGNLSTNGNNIGFSDDDKAKFGNSDDLEIFHQSSNGNSIIRESGGGNLSIQTNGTNVHFYDSANNAMLAAFNVGAAAKLYFNGSNKIETFADGVSVTGDLVTSDDVIINGGASDESVLRFRDGGSESWMLRQTNSDNVLSFRRNSNNYLQLQANGNVDISNGLDVTGAFTSNGTFASAIDDNTTDAFTLKQGSNEYITVDTNNSSELITLGNTTTNPKTAILGTGVGINTTSPDSLVKLDVVGGARIGNGIDGIIIENAGSNASIANAANIRRHSSTGNLHITAGTTTARNLIFGTKSNGAEIARFTGTGLCFNGDTAAANALDDYEEGTWTPVPEFGGSLTGGSYSTANCNYTKIGRSVTVKGNINFSSRGSSTGGFKITGLPFNDDYGGSYSHACGAAIVFHGPNADGSMNCFTSGTQVRFRMHNEANGNDEPQHGDFDNDTKIMFAITYFTDS